MEPFGLRGIELAVLHATASAHDLNLPRLELRMIAHAILVFDGALKDVSEDFHVLVRMRRETHPRGN